MPATDFLFLSFRCIVCRAFCAAGTEIVGERIVAVKVGSRSGQQAVTKLGLDSIRVALTT